MKKIVLLTALAAAIGLNASAAMARQASLVGSWRGGGIVVLPNGERQRARCRAFISKAPGRGAYNASYHCSTTSGRISQSARLHRTGRNSFAGPFYNSEYNVRGTIRATLHGNRQSISVRTNKGSGHIVMHR